MLLQRPHLLKQLEEDASRSLAMLGGLEGLGRSIMVGLMPLVDLEVLETKQAVTNAYLGGGCVALLVTLNVGRPESWMPRRWVVTGGFLSLVTAEPSCSWTTGCWASASGRRWASGSTPRSTNACRSSWLWALP